MANEATVRSSLQILEGKVDYRSQPTVFLADVAAGTKGPTPGALTATVAGIDVDLSELTVPGLCRIMNLDGTNFVEVGIWDGTTFFPMLDMLAGESYVIRLSQCLGEEFGTGTGSTGPPINTLRIKADTASCDVLVEAFEK